MATIKFKVIYMTHIMFLLHNIEVGMNKFSERKQPSCLSSYMAIVLPGESTINYKQYIIYTN